MGSVWDLLVVAITALAGSTFLTKYIKVGWAWLHEWLHGQFVKLPAPVTQLIAVVAGVVVVAATSDTAGITDEAVGAVASLLGTLLLALLDRAKPKR